MKRRICSLVLFLFLASILLCAVGCDSMEPLSYEEVQAIFLRDRELLLAVKAYFEALKQPEQYGSIHWDQDYRGNSYGHIPTEDAPISAVLEQLEGRDYQTITYNKNTVEFCLWNRGADAACGIVFTADGEELGIEYLTQAKALPEENWFYYVEDFNQWRIQSTAETASPPNTYR